MSALLIISLLIQKEPLFGKYKSNENESLILKQDSTFVYESIYHFNKYWSIGKWSMKSDTIYINSIPIYDKVKFESTDSLVLSKDEIYDTIVEFQKPKFKSKGRQVTSWTTKLIINGDELIEVKTNQHSEVKIKPRVWKKKQ